MEVQLSLANKWFKATNSLGAQVKLGSGLDDGVSPMEALLMAAGSCSGIDVVGILKKMRQPLVGLEIIVSGQRREEHPRYYQSIHIKYLLKGQLDEDKVKRAIELSLKQYCSVTNSLAAKDKVTYEFEIIGGDELLTP